MARLVYSVARLVCLGSESQSLEVLHIPRVAYRAGRALALPIFEFISSTHPFCLHNIFERI